MGEVKKQLFPVDVKYICDDCGIGEMNSTGVMLPVDPPIYEHECNNCKTVKNFKTIYPAIIFESSDEM